MEPRPESAERPAADLGDRFLFFGDVRAAVVIAFMVVLAITTAFIQEHKSNEAAARLRAMVHTTASVRRTPYDVDNPFSEIPIEQLVPGDVVRCPQAT